MSHRIWIAAAALAAAATLATAAAPAVPEDGAMRFEVVRDGSPIGRYDLTFDEAGSRLVVSSDLRLEVRFGPIPLFRFAQRGEEVWRDGRLEALAAVTDDNGRESWVDARAGRNGLRVSGPSGELTAPADLVPPSYWAPELLDGTRALDARNGALVEHRARFVGREPVTVGGRRIEARRYRIEGGKKLDAWYAPSGELVRLAFRIGDSALVMRRLDPPDPSAESADAD